MPLDDGFGLRFAFDQFLPKSNATCPKCGHSNPSSQPVIEEGNQPVARQCLACGDWYPCENFEPYVVTMPETWADQKVDYVIVTESSEVGAEVYDYLQRPKAGELPRAIGPVSDTTDSNPPHAE